MTLRFAFALLACVLVVSPSRAQSLAGDFLFADRGVGMQSFWRPAGPSRIQHMGGSSTLRVDVNENGSFNDPVDAEYVLPQGLEDGINYELSPDKQALYVTLDGTFTCGGLLVHFLDLPAGGGFASPTHQDCLPGGLPFNGASPEYFETQHFGSPTAGYTNTQRVSWMVTGPDAGTPTPEVRFFDLNAPTTIATVTMSSQWNWIKIAQSGNYALIKHDTDRPIGTSDYLLVSLCPGPDFGTVIHQLQNVQGVPSEANARITSVSGGQLTIEIFRGSTVLFTTTRPDCLATPTPEPGRCCIDGGCQYILPTACAALGGTFTPNVDCSGDPCAPTGACCIGATCSTLTQSACVQAGGSWSQGAACTPTRCVPTPQLTLTGSGSASSSWQQPVDYTFIAGNTGNGAASDTELLVFFPNGSSFISANPEPTYVSSFECRWDLGTLNPGASRTITLTLRAPCNLSSSVLSTYSLYSGSGQFVAGSPAISTTLSPEVADPATITLSSVIPPAPLGPGAVSTHTLSISNTSAITRQLAVFNVEPGNSAEFGEILTPDVGSWVVFAPDYFYWQGEFLPGETKQIAFTTRVLDCIDRSHASTGLNGGVAIRINSVCGAQRGLSAPPATSALLRPVAVSMGIQPVPGTVGEAVNGTQIVAPLTPLTIELELVNNLNTALPAAQFSLTIPDGLVVADPPFAGAVPPGVTYDAPSRTISFLGSLPPGPLSLAIAATLDPSVTCANRLNLSGGSSEGCADLAAVLNLYSYGGSISPGSLLFMGDNNEFFAWDPATEPESRRLGCLPGSGRSFARAADGRLFVVGSEDFMFDPSTLAITELLTLIQPQIIPAETGFYFFNDLVWDEDRGFLYLLAMNYSSGLGSVVQFNPANNVAQRVISRVDFSYRYDIQIDALGRPIIPLGTSVRRVDPSQPLPLASSNAQVVSPLVPSYGFPLGPQAAEYLSFLGLPGGGLRTLSSARWTQTSGFESVTFNLYSIAEGDAAGTFSVIEPQLAWRVSGNVDPLPPRPTQFTPRIDPALEQIVRLLDMGDDRVLLLDYGTLSPVMASASIIDLASGISVSSLFPATTLSFPVRDVIWIEGPATCPADWNGDGGVDGDDVIAFFADWDVSNADFNNDGGTDGDDVIAFFTRWDANC